MSNAEQQQPSAEEQQRYYSMRRTACLVLARHHSNSHKDDIDPIMQALPVEQQQKYINKMYSKAVEDCEQIITPEEVNQLYVENPNFDPRNLFHLFATVDYTAISKESFKLSKNQEMIVAYIKNFDEEMEVKREEQKAEEDKLSGDDRNDFKVLPFLPRSSESPPRSSAAASSSPTSSCSAPSSAACSSTASRSSARRTSPRRRSPRRAPTPRPSQPPPRRRRLTDGVCL